MNPGSNSTEIQEPGKPTNGMIVRVFRYPQKLRFGFAFGLTITTIFFTILLTSRWRIDSITTNPLTWKIPIWADFLVWGFFFIVYLVAYWRFLEYRPISISEYRVISLFPFNRSRAIDWNGIQRIEKRRHYFTDWARYRTTIKIIGQGLTIEFQSDITEYAELKSILNKQAKIHNIQLFSLEKVEASGESKRNIKGVFIGLLKEPVIKRQVLEL